jgi:hypothetical protein
MGAEKYTQVRFESKKANDAKTMILHNTRCMNPHYIRNTMQHNKEKNTIIIFGKNDAVEKYEIQTKNKESKTDKHLRLLVNDILKKQLDDEIQYCKKQSKNYREKRNATVIDGIVTLSNDINDMYESGQITKQELNERFVKTVKNMERELGLKALNASIHYDEKTPHR